MFFSLKFLGAQNNYLFLLQNKIRYNLLSFLSVFQSGVNDIVAAMQQYQSSLVSSLRSQLQTVFQQHQESGLEKDALAVFDKIEDPFGSVSTAYRQDSVIKKNFKFVESEEVSVGYSSCIVKKGKKS